MFLRICIQLIFVLLSFLSAFPQTDNYIPAGIFGGKQALKDLIKNELVYPESSRTAKIEGIVVIKFIVKSDSTTNEVKISESVSPEIDNEAIRLFNYLLWIPANTDGKFIEENSELEIRFKLKKYNKLIKQRGYDEIEYPHLPVDKSFTIYETKDLKQLPKPIFDKPDLTFSDFIGQNLKYPDLAKKQGVSGVVELFFVVEPSGNISNIKTKQHLGAGCNEEAIRLVKLLNWYPGLKDGMAVRTSITLKITFDLTNSESLRYVPANNNNQM